VKGTNVDVDGEEQLTSLSENSFDVLSNGHHRNRNDTSGSTNSNWTLMTMTDQQQRQSPFNNHFTELSRLPMDHWLLQKTVEKKPKNQKMNEWLFTPSSLSEPTNLQQQTTENFPDLNTLVKDMKIESEESAYSFLTNSTLHRKQVTNSGCFDDSNELEQKAMEIGHSPLVTFENEKWLQDTNKICNDNDDINYNKKFPWGEKYGNNDISFWLKNYPPKKNDRPMNEMSEEVAIWESVLGWKNILEKIHACGEEHWLSPSSRPIETEHLLKYFNQTQTFDSVNC